MNDFSTLSKVIAAVLFVIFFSCCSASHPMYANSRNAIGRYDSVLVDRDGNQYPVKLFGDHSLWMTTNLKMNIPGSYCYNDSPKYCEQYGRLYTWKTAQEGCSLLGEGWRLPAEDEWKQLAGLNVDATKDSDEIRKKAYQSLLSNTNSAFNARLGGGRSTDGQYARMEAHGFYWTISQEDSSLAWFINFAKGSQSLYINDGEKTRSFSVRCVKSVDTLK